MRFLCPQVKAFKQPFEFSGSHLVGALLRVWRPGEAFLFDQKRESVDRFPEVDGGAAQVNRADAVTRVHYRSRASSACARAASQAGDGSWLKSS